MHVPGQGSRKSKKLADDIIGEEDYMPTDEVFPSQLLVKSIELIDIEGSRREILEAFWK